MKFNQALSEGILLKRYHRFLVEVSVGHKKKRMLFCPNTGALTGCDVLGSRIWFSRANLILDGTLDVWELVEVDGGWLVSVNTKHTRTVIREALKQERIELLKGFQYLQPPVPSLDNGIELLWREDGEQCFIHIEPIVWGDQRCKGYFPEEAGEGLAALKDLIAVRELGHRAVLLYCVQHTSAQSVALCDHVDANYRLLLQEAIAKGVEVVAYRFDITLRGIQLGKEIPVDVTESFDLNPPFKDQFSGI